MHTLVTFDGAGCVGKTTLLTAFAERLVEIQRPFIHLGTTEPFVKFGSDQLQNRLKYLENPQQYEAWRHLYDRLQGHGQHVAQKRTELFRENSSEMDKMKILVPLHHKMMLLLNEVLRSPLLPDDTVVLLDRSFLTFYAYNFTWCVDPNSNVGYETINFASQSERYLSGMYETLLGSGVQTVSCILYDEEDLSEKRQTLLRAKDEKHYDKNFELQKHCGRFFNDFAKWVQTFKVNNESLFPKVGNVCLPIAYIAGEQSHNRTNRYLDSLHRVLAN